METKSDSGAMGTEASQTSAAALEGNIRSGIDEWLSVGAFQEQLDAYNSWKEYAQSVRDLQESDGFLTLPLYNAEYPVDISSNGVENPVDARYYSPQNVAKKYGMRHTIVKGDGSDENPYKSREATRREIINWAIEEREDILRERRRLQEHSRAEQFAAKYSAKAEAYAAIVKFIEENPDWEKDWEKENDPAFEEIQEAYRNKLQDLFDAVEYITNQMGVNKYDNEEVPLCDLFKLYELLDSIPPAQAASLNIDDKAKKQIEQNHKAYGLAYMGGEGIIYWYVKEIRKALIGKLAVHPESSNNEIQS